MFKEIVQTAKAVKEKLENIRSQPVKDKSEVEVKKTPSGFIAISGEWRLQAVRAAQKIGLWRYQPSPHDCLMVWREEKFNKAIVYRILENAALVIGRDRVVSFLQSPQFEAWSRA